MNKIYYNLKLKELAQQLRNNSTKIEGNFFDILGLTEDERNEVYWSVCEMEKNRLKKARSV
uniref:Uncharacterized protein n=1 Tax=candidate division CPR3 bacterium TaxID=2268181 RepID=A0A7V3JA50_UNCC3